MIDYEMTPLQHALRHYSEALDIADARDALYWAKDARLLVAEIKAGKVRLPVELDPLLREAAK